MSSVAARAKRWSLGINWVVERLCVALLVVLVLDVWLGVLARYVLPFRLTFTEELARYLMIWMALLAVSCGIAHREHIGVEFIFARLPAPVRRWLALAFDLTAFAFFAILFFYGLGFTVTGFQRLSMIYQIPKGWFFAGVPIAAGLACLQLALMAVHDALADRAALPDAAGAE
jgi:TRAP-type C4-dicarboxylate transport system permease small subunit